MPEGLDVAADQLRQIIERERLAVVGEKHRTLVGFGNQVRPRVHRVFVE